MYLRFPFMTEESPDFYVEDYISIWNIFFISVTYEGLMMKYGGDIEVTLEAELTTRGQQKGLKGHGL